MQQIQFISISPDDLIDIIDSKIAKRLEELKHNFQPKEPTEFLSRNDVAEMLSIDLSTVHNYTKRKILQPYQIGGRVYYKRSEVEKSIIKLK